MDLTKVPSEELNKELRRRRNDAERTRRIAEAKDMINQWQECLQRLENGERPDDVMCPVFP